MSSAACALSSLRMITSDVVMPINSTAVAMILVDVELILPPSPRPSLSITPPASELVTKLEKAAAQKPMLKISMAYGPNALSSWRIITPKLTSPLCG